MATRKPVTVLKLMTITKLKLGIISAVVIAGVVATLLVIQHQARIKLRQENQSLRQQVEQLQTDNEDLSNRVVQANSSQKIPSNQFSELLRLRGEVGSLRKQTNELGRVQAENQRLRSSLATASATPKTGAFATAAQDKLPRESWAFVGYADPESAFQSATWAMSQGDAKTFLASIAPNGQTFKDMEGKSESEIATSIKEEIGNKMTGFKIIDKESVSDGEVILTVYADGINEVGRFKLQRVGNDWKIDGPVKGDKDTGKPSAK